jgi:hypothetical protein
MRTLCIVDQVTDSQAGQPYFVIVSKKRDIIIICSFLDSSLGLANPIHKGIPHWNTT